MWPFNKNMKGKEPKDTFPKLLYPDRIALGVMPLGPGIKWDTPSREESGQKCLRCNSLNGMLTHQELHNDITDSWYYKDECVDCGFLYDTGRQFLKGP